MYVCYLQSTHNLMALCRELISADLLGFIHVVLIIAVIGCTSFFECCLLLTVQKRRSSLKKLHALALSVIGNHKLAVTNIQYLCYHQIELKKRCTEVRTQNVCFQKDRRHCCHHTCSCQIYTLTSTPLISQPVCRLPLQHLPCNCHQPLLLIDCFLCAWYEHHAIGDKPVCIVLTPIVLCLQMCVAPFQCECNRPYRSTYYHTIGLSPLSMYSAPLTSVILG